MLAPPAPGKNRSPGTDHVPTGPTMGLLFISRLLTQAHSWLRVQP